ncbi:harmonin-like [Chiloscyllium punctatum]|uniref:harmonin-like n=1 Tax=Chiloscyllium punctatum TaxID=137246 RepID=UPI003B633C67
MLEKEKQLKINRLVQEVSETEREDLEESVKVQHWVERLCQTRLEQISSAENESLEGSTAPPPPSTSVRKFVSGLQLHTTDLDDINLDQFEQSAKRMAPHPPASHLVPLPQPTKIPSPTVTPSRKKPAPPPPSPYHPTPSHMGSPVQLPPPPPPPPPIPIHPIALACSHGTIPEARESNLTYHSHAGMESANDWQVNNHSSKVGYSPVHILTGEHSYPNSYKVLTVCCEICYDCCAIFL